MPRPLPVLSCSGCGACCTHVGTPPGYAAFFGPHGVMAWARGSDDHRRALATPEPLRAELTAYYAGVFAGTTPDRSGMDCPCLWYDPATRGCRHYEHRPEVCREFDVDGASCREIRVADGIV